MAGEGHGAEENLSSTAFTRQRSGRSGTTVSAGNGHDAEENPQRNEYNDILREERRTAAATTRPSWPRGMPSTCRIRIGATGVGA